LHLTAQLGAENRAKENIDSVPLFDRKLEECSERELLVLKVDSYRKIVDSATNAYETESISPFSLFDCLNDLADAEIELYRYTGQQEELRVALKNKVDAREQILRIANAHREVGSTRITMMEFHELEARLLDAVLEQKRILASLNGK
jgi:hypothetical protein